MRRLRYSVAASVDGFIAGPGGEFDWIPPDETIDFAALFAEFDTFLMGRRTYEVLLAQGEANPTRGRRVIVASRTLDPAAHPGATVLRDDVPRAVAALKREDGKDVWLFGGGVLFRELLDAGLVDTVEIALVPVLLGDGIPVVATGRPTPLLRLVGARPLPSGIVLLSYEPAAGAR